jgi:hypothetical protein
MHLAETGADLVPAMVHAGARTTVAPPRGLAVTNFVASGLAGVSLRQTASAAGCPHCCPKRRQSSITRSTPPCAVAVGQWMSVVSP